MALECALAVGTSGAIGAWAIWTTGIGGYVWPIVGGSAALIAVLKPILQLPKGIEQYSKLYVGHTAIYYELQRLVSEVQALRAFTEEMFTQVQVAQERFKQLALEDDPRPAEKLRRKYYEETNREIPPNGLWVPD